MAAHIDHTDSFQNKSLTNDTFFITIILYFTKGYSMADRGKRIMASKAARARRKSVKEIIQTRMENLYNKLKRKRKANSK